MTKKHFSCTKFSKQGSAIITVIIFITIFLLLISTFILYIRGREKILTNFGYEVQTYQNAQSVLNVALKEYDKNLQTHHYKSHKYSYSLFGKDSSFAEIKPWGFFLLCTAKSKISKISSTRRFLIGTYPEDIYGFAMIIGKTYLPVTVSGTSKITGDVAVGRQSVKPGILKGRRYKGEKTVYGNIYRDNTSYLPEANTELLTAQIDRLKKLYTQAESISKIFESNDKITRINLSNHIFLLNENDINTIKQMGIRDIIGPGILIVNSDIHIEEINLYKQITIYSEKQVEIAASSSIDHVLLFSKNLKINGPGKLRGQFFANENLSIDNGAELLYPSIAGLILNNNQKDNVLHIGKKVTIEGSVLIVKKADTKNQLENKHKLFIDEGAIINGITYSDNYTELKGTVFGTVLTGALSFYLEPTNYVNWIHDAEINRPVMLRNFIYPIAFKKTGKLMIIKEI